MITGAHSIVYSTNPDADRAVLRDVFKLTHVDVGRGWLIFGLPPAEVAVHPSDKNDVHELYLMCDDVEALVAEMKRHALTCGPVRDQGWGLLTQLTLPGGGKLGIYQPRHPRPAPMTADVPGTLNRDSPRGHSTLSVPELEPDATWAHGSRQERQSPRGCREEDTDHRNSPTKNRQITRETSHAGMLIGVASSA